MTLLTTKRIIANGLAQHRFAEVWPGIERARPHEALLASLSSPKLAEGRALLAALAVEQQRKVVVFSQWRRMLRLAHWAVGDLLADAGLRAAFFTGQESPRQRTQNLVDFHDDPAVRVLFASDAGGVGLNLQRAASACVLLDLPWNPAVLEQRVGRIYRLGQKRPIASLVADKRALFRGLFDGTSDSVLFERSGSFLANLEKLVGDDAAPSAVGSEEADEEVAEPALARWLGDSDDSGEGDERAASARSADPDLSVADADRTAPQSAQPIAAPDVARLFAEIAVERTASGGLRIEARPETAEALASLFEGLAETLRRAAR
jgi:superfamily II DNA/RNA helicase